MIDIILQPMAAFVATLCFSVLFNVDKRQLLFCGAVGGIGKLSNYVCELYLSEGLSTLISAAIIAMLARLLAPKRQSPVTVFII